MINKIIEHITDTYDFEFVYPIAPRNEFQLLKRNFYLFIKNHVSNNLFLFLRNASPVKTVIERDDKSIWFKKRTNSGLYEIEIRPIPPEAAIYNTYNDGIFQPQYSGNFKARM